MFGKVLPIEATTEDAVGAALGGERPVAHPRRDMRPDAVVEPRDVRLGDSLLRPPDLVRIADGDARDLDRLSAHGPSTCIRTAPCRCGARGTPADEACRRRSTPRTRAGRRASGAPRWRHAWAAADRTATSRSAAARA